MIPLPILRRELKVSAIRRDIYVLRLVTAALIGGAIFFAGFLGLQGDVAGRSVFPAAGLHSFGRTSLVLTVVVEVILLGFLVPGLVGGAIAEERERDTLPFLLLSRLTRLEIVAAKLIGRLAPSISVALVSLPFVAFGAYLAALPLVAVVAIVGGLCSTAVMMGCVSLYSSARYLRAANARSVATLTVWAWLLLPPIATVLPGSTDPLLDKFAQLGKFACRWIAPSSPLSFLTDRLWYTSGRPGALTDQILMMVATQAAIAVPAALASVFGLKRHEPRRATLAGTGQHRAPCGDDPIFWHEYLLPMSLSGSMRPMAVLGQLVALLRLLVVILFQILMIALVAAIPITLVVLTGKLAVPAFQEHWMGGADFGAREDLRSLVLGVSALIGMICVLGGTTTASARITLEREKGTWISLLTTPLEGSEILGSKLRATAWSQARLGWIVLPLLLVGVVCGAFHWVGAVLGAIQLTAIVALGIAVGNWLGVRPAAVSTTQSASALAGMFLTMAEAAYLGVVLFPGRTLIGVLGWSLPWQVGIVTILIAMPIGEALAAAWFVRRAYAKFDKYVDRPTRQGAARASSGRVAGGPAAATGVAVPG